MIKYDLEVPKKLAPSLLNVGTQLITVKATLTGTCGGRSEVAAHELDLQIKRYQKNPIQITVHALDSSKNPFSQEIPVPVDTLDSEILRRLENKSDSGKTQVELRRQGVKKPLISKDTEILPPSAWIIGDCPELQPLVGFVNPQYAGIYEQIIQPAERCELETLLHVDSFEKIKHLSDSQVHQRRFGGGRPKADERVAVIAEALFSRIQRLQIKWDKDPFKIDRGWQMVRSHSRVLNEQRANCIDISLLFAACLEYIGIWPVIVLVKTTIAENGTQTIGFHAIPGCFANKETSENPSPWGEAPGLLCGVVIDAVACGNLVLWEPNYVTDSGQTFQDARDQGVDALRSLSNTVVWVFNVVKGRKSEENGDRVLKPLLPELRDPAPKSWWKCSLDSRCPRIECVVCIFKSAFKILIRLLKEHPWIAISFIIALLLVLFAFQQVPEELAIVLENSWEQSPIAVASTGPNHSIVLTLETNQAAIATIKPTRTFTTTGNEHLILDNLRCTNCFLKVEIYWYPTEEIDESKETNTITYNNLNDGTTTTNLMVGDSPFGATIGSWRPAFTVTRDGNDALCWASFTVSLVTNETPRWKSLFLEAKLWSADSFRNGSTDYIETKP